MSSKYKPGEDAIAHFVTFAVVGWVDVFSREQYKEIFINSLKYCQQEKGPHLAQVCFGPIWCKFVLPLPSGASLFWPIWRKFVLAHPVLNSNSFPG
jgi:hypothetical protein